jgi:hypothetical protein
MALVDELYARCKSRGESRDNAANVGGLSTLTSGWKQGQTDDEGVDRSALAQMRNHLNGGFFAIMNKRVERQGNVRRIVVVCDSCPASADIQREHTHDSMLSRNTDSQTRNR